MAAADSLDDAANVITEALRPKLEVLTRDVDIYSWHPASPTELQATSASDPIGYRDVQEHARMRMTSYGSGAELGDGFYAAEDAGTTRSFGEENWALIQMTLPKGTRYISAVYNVGRPSDLTTDPRKLEAALKTIGCKYRPGIYGQVGVEEIYNMGVVFRYLPGVPDEIKVRQSLCRAILLDIFENRLKVQGIKYSYTTHFCTNDSNPVAFVVTGQSWLTPDRVKIFTGNTRDDLKDRLAIQGMVTKANSQNSSLSSLDKLWPDIDRDSEDARAAAKREKPRLMGCGPPYFEAVREPAAISSCRQSDIGLNGVTQWMGAVSNCVKGEH